MLTRTLMAAAAVAATIGFAHADAVSSKVKFWNPQTRLLTMESNEIF